MSTNLKYLLAIILLIIAIFFSGWLVGYKYRPSVVVKPQTITIHDSLRVHDTIRTSGDNIIVYKQARADTIHDTLFSSVNCDSSVCYSFDKQEKDGAYIKASLCSQKLPPVKPLDLTTEILYKPKIDTTRTITITNNVVIDKTTPLLLNWKFYAGLLIAFFTGRETHK